MSAVLCVCEKILIIFFYFGKKMSCEVSEPFSDL